MQFLSFMEPIFARKVPMIALILLKKSLVFHILLVYSIEEGFLIFPCYSLELCIQMGISFLFSFPFRFSSFHSYYLWSILNWFMWKVWGLWLCSFFFFFACACQASFIEKSMLLDRLTDIKYKVVDTWGERKGGNRGISYIWD